MSIIKGFSFNKGLGQNFILDEVLLQSVVAELGLAKTDTVVEVGTGAGTLTRVLARTVARVVTFEVDKRLTDVLVKQFKGFDNIDLRWEDGLRARVDVGSFIVVANIPYYITTPLVMKFMADENCSRVCVLVQMDVAKRIVAQPGGKEYGALSVGLQAIGDCRILRKIPRGVFTPVPSVDSAFVVIEKRESGAGISDAFLKRVFGARRKTVLNALGVDKILARRVLAEVGIDETLRPEQIAVDKFRELWTKLDRILQGGSL
jgi:16S rRNA (adenine1518-N6/adenine1519-N6)-dimethyltransferase